MDATRRRDGKHVMLKKIYPGEGPHELLIAQLLFSSREFARDPRNHCVPLLDIIEIPRNGQKLMVKPLLRPFSDPHFQRPPHYYLIDFGFSRQYHSRRTLDIPLRGGDKSAPEHRNATRCNPFYTDVYYLGNLVRQ